MVTKTARRLLPLEHQTDLSQTVTSQRTGQDGRGRQVWMGGGRRLRILGTHRQYLTHPIHRRMPRKPPGKEDVQAEAPELEGKLSRQKDQHVHRHGRGRRTKSFTHHLPVPGPLRGTEVTEVTKADAGSPHCETCEKGHSEEIEFYNGKFSYENRTQTSTLQAGSGELLGV